jgi:hypothetical protein
LPPRPLLRSDGLIGSPRDLGIIPRCGDVSLDLPHTRGRVV